jgi:hypothetical protein
MLQSGTAVANELHAFQAWRMELRIVLGCIACFVACAIHMSGLALAVAQSTVLCFFSCLFALCFLFFDARSLQPYPRLRFAVASGVAVLAAYHVTHVSWWLLPLGTVAAVHVVFALTDFNRYPFQRGAWMMNGTTE